MNNKIKGIAASNGIGLAKAYILVEPNLSNIIENAQNKNIEIDLYNKAKQKSVFQLEQIKAIALERLGKDKADIFEAHINITEDPEIENEVLNLIEQSKTAEFAVNSVFSKYQEIFLSYEDEYFKERASDILDIKKRYIANLKGIELPNIANISEEVIIVAKDLTPSETALLNKKYVKGFITEQGGRTSHAAIMARTMEIPAVLSVKNLLNLVKKNDLIALDGFNGEVELKPKDISFWKEKIERTKLEALELKKYIDKKTITLDGQEVLLESNIGNATDAQATLNYGSEGVGLYRSEFLYMNSNEWPDEETQFQGYKQALEILKNQLVVIRTLDIGGDKHLPYFKFQEEMNPFLGYRAIRLCLDKIDIFTTQLRALGRASAFGKLAIMFPMIATVEEFDKAKKLTLEVFNQLRKEGHKVSEDVQIGMMIEIPAAAANANNLAKRADFFSIGTNDLIQYTMACDRMSPSVSYLYQPNNPAILRLIKMTIDAGIKNNKWVGMCGEMAGDILSIPLLLGMGLHAFSMSPTSILKARKIINNLNYKECKHLAENALELSTLTEVDELVSNFLKNKNLY